METKTEKFERVARPRIENVMKGLELLQNLGRSEYEASDARKREIIEGFSNAVLALSMAWKIGPDPAQAQAVAEIADNETTSRAAEAISLVALAEKAEGGATVENEIRWAIDLVMRGDYDTAINRLRRCLGLEDAA